MLTKDDFSKNILYLGQLNRVAIVWLASHYKETL